MLIFKAQNGETCCSIVVADPLAGNREIDTMFVVDFVPTCKDALANISFSAIIISTIR